LGVLRHPLAGRICRQHRGAFLRNGAEEFAMVLKSGLRYLPGHGNLRL
jgi:hypothetical protein